MPRKVTSWECERCGHSFGKWAQARNCEFNHITQQAIKESQENLARKLSERFGE